MYAPPSVAIWSELQRKLMLKLINGKWVYQDPPKHPKCIEKINKHMEFLFKCYIDESFIFGACFIGGSESPYWKYENLITD